MTTPEIESALFAYSGLLSRATTIEERQDEGGRLAMPEHSSFLGSLVVTLLFVPFSIYFGVVCFIFALECYQFFTVWNLVSRTRSHSDGVPRLSQARDIWNSRYHGLSSDDDQRVKEEPERTEQRIQERCLQIHKLGAQHDLQSTSCPICLCKLERPQRVASIRDCHCRTANLFHYDCLMQWLKERPSCPYCRMELLPPLHPPFDLSLSSSPLSDSLEMASLQVEHYLCNAIALFGEFVASYTY